MLKFFVICAVLIGLVAVIAVATASSDLPLCQDYESTHDVKEGLLDTANAIFHIISFLVNHLDTINPDAVSSLFFMRDRLAPPVNSGLLPSGVATLLRRAIEEVELIKDVAFAKARESDPKYFEQTKVFLIDDFWSLEFPERDLPSKPQNLKNMPRNKNYTEAVSDMCLAELFAEGEDKCVISEECLLTELSPGQTRYIIAHQLLWALQARRCEVLTVRETKSKIAEESLVKLADEFCARMWQEFEDIEAGGFGKEHDLSMEQVAFCRWAGYSKFTRRNFLEKILDWQKPIGCFGVSEHRRIYTPHGSKRRNKRKEQVMPQGCLAHRTAVALLSLSVYMQDLATCDGAYIK